MRDPSPLLLVALLVSGCGGRTPLEGAAPGEQAGTPEASTPDASVVDAFADVIDAAAETSDAGADADALEGCFGAGIVAIASGEPLPLDIAIDTTSVYWVDEGPSSDCSKPSGSVSKAPKGGGAVTVLAQGELSPVVLALDGTSAYWGDGCGSGRIRTAPLGGGAVRELPTPSTTFFTDHRFLAVDSRDVYFNDYGMLSIPKDGTAPEQGLPGDSYNFVEGLAVDSTGAYWTALVGGTGGTNAVQSYVPSVGQVATIDIPPGSGSLGAIALDDAWVYYVNDLAIARVPKAGGASSVLATRSRGVLTLAVDDAYVYWAEGYGQNGTPLLRMPKAGGAPSVLAPDASNVRRLVVDERCVYWVEADYQLGRIVRAPK
jgi:hypothetical protein